MATRVWGLSKKRANYRPAPKTEVRCDRCKYMFPPLALGGCRLVRGADPGRGHLRRVHASPLSGVLSAGTPAQGHRASWPLS
jgi:hypothetical protein